MNVNVTEHLAVSPELEGDSTRVNLAVPVVIGHRGMGVSHHNPANPYPENTRASFLAAYTAGAKWVEMDLLPSADGDLVLHHDHYIDIHRDGHPVPVWEIPTRQLLNWGVELLDGLSEDLPPDLGLYLELKVSPGDVDPTFGPPSLNLLVDWATDVATQRPVLLSSFDPYAAAEMRKSGVPTAWIGNECNHFQTAITAAIRAGFHTLVLHGNALERPSIEVDLGLQLARKHNLTLWSWAPTLSRIGDYADMGITGFCVNEVAEAVATLNTRR